jgi:preprotein translocase subunit SecA
MYEKLAGMTGTAATEAEEFNRIYGLDVIVIPTHKPITRIDHGDVIYKTMRAKYAAIAEEVKTLSEKGQPVLIGTTSIEKNDLVASFLKRKRIPFNILNAKNHAKEAMVIADAGKPGAVTVATNIAGRGVDIVLGGSPPDDANYKTKNALKKAREEWQANHNAVLASGGLFVIGTERHESRRIDNQLRGRSGRQGDVGGSRFYVSLEDDIMRIFGGEQVSRFMTMFRLPEDVPLEHKMVGRAIEQAQVKVEGFHFDSRKRVVEYDDVMNKQRGIIYGRRHKILKMVSEIEEESKATSSKDTLDSSLHKQIMGNIEADIENIVTMYAPQGYTDTEYEQIIREFSNIVPFDIDSQNHIQKEIEKLKHAEKISIHLQDIFHKVWKSREDSVGKSQLHQIEVFVTLRTIDKLWMEHIDNMQNLREGIGLRGYGQRDPLVEYKQEAFTMFERLLANIDYEINRHVMRVQVAQRTAAPMQVIAQHPHAQTPGVTTQKPSKKPQTVRRHPQNSSAQKQDDKTKKKLGRNDPCWCGSGKKWKKCHWPDLS